MATLGFNSPAIRNPVAPIISRALISLSKTLSIPPSAFPSSIAGAYRHRHRPLHPGPNSISESSVSPPASSKEEEEESGLEEEEEVDPCVQVRYLDPAMEAGSIREWEMDFCSRPILDERGKKVWELVVCDGTLSLQYTRFFPNNVINSVTLRDAIASISASLGVPLPQKIRFFRSLLSPASSRPRFLTPTSFHYLPILLALLLREEKIIFNYPDATIVTGTFWAVLRSQMQTIITKACNELGIKAVPSKRCLSLLLWLEERYETVYTRHPGFQQGSKPLLALDNPFPMELPENLIGEKWAFVQLPFSAVQEEALSLETRYAFGASLDLDLLGLEIEDKTLVPGLAVASSRAKPLAAWMNGLEVCSVEVDIGRACLILSVGVATRYIYATYKKNAATTQEAEAWEDAKKACGGLHFLAIQESLDSEDCVGFWLLLDVPPPLV